MRPSAVGNQRGLLVIKIGGAVITDKSSYRTFNQADLKQAAVDIAAALSVKEAGSSNSPAVVIVHGAGSFAHVEAKQHRLSATLSGATHLVGAYPVQKHGENGSKASSSPSNGGSLDPRLVGLGRGTVGLAMLHAEVLRSLSEVNLPVVSVPLATVGIPVGASLTKTKNDKKGNNKKRNRNEDEQCNGEESSALERAEAIEAAVQGAVQRALSLAMGGGVIPVLHGDFALCCASSDTLLQMWPDIISGDRIVETLARCALAGQWIPDSGHCRVVFLTDVNGVYDADPKIDSNAKLIRQITACSEKTQQDDSTTVQLQDTATERGSDVTGRMKGKLEAALSLVNSTGISVHILKSNQPALRSLFDLDTSVGDIVKCVEATHITNCV